MGHLTPAHLRELTNPTLLGATVWVSRGESRSMFHLIEPRNHGMKGVVWRGKDDLGNDVAVKFVPLSDYEDRSLIDEISEASRLGTDLFAAIRFFGVPEIRGGPDLTEYRCVVTEWLDGRTLEHYFRHSSITVDEFSEVAERLLRVLATLKRLSLCHEDLHPGNVILEDLLDPLTHEKVLHLKVIDTGTIKRLVTRERLLAKLRADIEMLRSHSASDEAIRRLEDLLAWKTPDDHLRVVECLLYAANALVRNYHRLDFWERRFVDRLQTLFHSLTDPDPTRRLDDPTLALSELRALIRASRHADNDSVEQMNTPFDYISAEMIQTDAEFARLFSSECPWLPDCVALQPLYIYGPRGCGKSSVLRWLSFKVQATDGKLDFATLTDVGVYISCSVELRSRFWLLTDSEIDALQAPIIRYYVLLLLEELFDTLAELFLFNVERRHDFDIDQSALDNFSRWFVTRLQIGVPPAYLRLQGQDHFTFLRGLTRKLRWDTWSTIQSAAVQQGLPDPALLADTVREVRKAIGFLSSRHITFLLDDYSNQRIPIHLQRKLNQTISFAKQGTPLFKVSSEYNGVDLEGIQEGREVTEINVGERYTSLPDDDAGVKFLRDILDKRLETAAYLARTEQLLGHWSLAASIQRALAAELAGEGRFYYHGLEAIHLLCSGDLALALDLVRRIFDAGGVDEFADTVVPAAIQHRTIKNFSNDELRRIKHIVPYGPELYDIAINLGGIARAAAAAKMTRKRDRQPEPASKTHLDIRTGAIRALQPNSKTEKLYNLLTSRAILITLESSRSRLAGLTERLQLRRIYLPAFQAPLKRETPIKIDSPDDLVSLLTEPEVFAERELKRADIDAAQLRLALRQIEVIDGTVSP